MLHQPGKVNILNLSDDVIVLKMHSRNRTISVTLATLTLRRFAMK